jgi:UDPglucose 6-dehydrogenase
VQLLAQGVEIIIYEPTMDQADLYRSEIIKELAEFKQRSDVINANPRHAALDDVAEKVYTRDWFGGDACIPHAAQGNM